MVLRLPAARDPGPAAMVPAASSERSFELPRPPHASLLTDWEARGPGQSNPAKWPITSPANPDASPMMVMRSPLRQTEPEVTRAS